MKGEKGAEHESNIARSTGLALSEHRLLPAGHALKVKEFTVSLLWPENDVSGIKGHYFAIDPGAYNFHCELELPGFSATGEGGKQLTPAAGEWTGKLTTRSLNVVVVAPDAPAPKPGLKAVEKGAGEAKREQPDVKAPRAEIPPPAFLASGVKPDSKQLFNEDYAAFAVQSEKDVNFVLCYQGSLSNGIAEWSSGAKWRFNGNVYLVDRAKTAIAGKNVNKRVIAVKYTSDAPTTLFLDGKAYDLAAQPRMTSMGALDEAPGRVFLLRDEGEPFQTHRTLALRNEQDLATIGNFAVFDSVNADLYADNRRIQEMEGWVLAFDFQVPLRHSGGHRIARLRIFPDGRVLSSPNGRVLHELKIPADELAELLRWLAEDQKVPVVKAQAAQPGDPKPAIGQEFDTWAGGVSFLQFKHNDLLHSMTVGSHLRNPGSGKELVNPDASAFKAIGERLAELDKKAATAPAKAGANNAKPAVDGYAKSGVPIADLNAPMTWSEEQSGLCLGMSIPEDADWRIGKEVKVELWVCNPGDKDAKIEFPARNDFGLRVLMTGKDGKEHAAGFTMLRLQHQFTKLLLPSGHVVKVREFTVVLAPPGANQLGPNKTFALAPGEYKFRCEHDLMWTVIDRKSTRLNSSHERRSRMPSSA